MSEYGEPCFHCERPIKPPPGIVGCPCYFRLNEAEQKRVVERVIRRHREAIQRARAPRCPYCHYWLHEPEPAVAG